MTGPVCSILCILDSCSGQSAAQERTLKTLAEGIFKDEAAWFEWPQTGGASRLADLHSYPPWDVRIGRFADLNISMSTKKRDKIRSKIPTCGVICTAFFTTLMYSVRSKRFRLLSSSQRSFPSGWDKETERKGDGSRQVASHGQMPGSSPTRHQNTKIYFYRD
ncbi:hypothetical protein TEQG_05059 [Trichophyton equinum CBS 127.97]|uniref:Uncharacterized protein n=1 Tax=Trichophyton equinum (strain ATCC MYA-4606 / CBS 127.97) TaxID=559882 RepID=F2PW95_TRIEC|nr:hypothetical protein TEQG_05059 [Trichophyton equinum CBS 127.97]